MKELLEKLESAYEKVGLHGETINVELNFAEVNTILHYIRISEAFNQVTKQTYRKHREKTGVSL